MRTTGIGFEAALTLAQAGAHVIVAARNQERGKHAVQRLQQGAPNAAQIEFLQVDMSSIASIVTFANTIKQRGLPLHVLIQNAGVFLQPASITDEGLEVKKRGAEASSFLNKCVCTGHHRNQLHRPPPVALLAGRHPGSLQSMPCCLCGLVI